MLEITDPAVLENIKIIGYPLLLLTMILEGPVVTLLASLAASLGFFNIFVIFVLSILGDIIGDIILYTIGYFGGSVILAKAEKFLNIKPAIVTKIEKLLQNHGKKIIFGVKATTGLCWITFITAGSIKMNFKSFLIGSFFGGIIWSSFLVITGYFFGYAFKQISDHIRYAGVIIFLAVVIFLTLITFYKKRRSKEIFIESP